MKLRRILSAAVVVTSMAFAIPAQAGHCMKQQMACCKDNKVCKKDHMDCCKKSGGKQSCSHKDDCCSKECGTHEKS
ncbi:MAG TPA: hypothetical protein VN380_21990 [Thermoanaerobaculia bacterium]|jgi:hypothetical protein|nr:hypothetical protein [Thermoanaerobaculia bacterium]